MSQIVREKYMEAVEEVEKAGNEAYTRKLNPLIGLVESLYRGLQDKGLKEGEEIYVWGFENELGIWKLSKHGIKMGNGQMISVEEYVEKAVQYEKNNDQKKFTILNVLISKIESFEKNTDRELTRKYLEEVEKKLKVKDLIII